VNAVAKVTKPSLEGWAVVLSNKAAICADAGVSSDGSPLSRSVDEGNVDVRVSIEIVGLARLSVGVEEKVNASSLLQIGMLVMKQMVQEFKQTYGSGQRHAARDQVARTRTTSGHHAKLLLGDEVDKILDLGLEGNLIGVCRLVRVGGGITGVGIGERHFV